MASTESGLREYATKNLQLACYVLAKGADLIAIKGQRGRAEFVFHDPKEDLAWSEHEFSADAPVPVRQFCWAMREIRAQMDRAFGTFRPSR
jgi:hypothetical protein